MREMSAMTRAATTTIYKKWLRIEAPVFNSLSLKFDEILNSLYAERLNFIYAEL